jgi:uncharacterized protein (TIGR03083 family)
MTDLPQTVDAYEHTMRALLALGTDRGDADFARPTECPGWTVQDQFSHVVGIERWMLGEPEPAHQVPDLAHVHGEFGHRVEVAVDLRRARSGRDVVAELADVLTTRLAMLRTPSVSASDVVPNPLGGQGPLGTVLKMRTFDIWTHEQDVRRALDRPGNLDSPAAAAAVAWIARALPRVVARGAAVPSGRSVHLDVHGPVAFAETVTVRVGDDGRAVGEVTSGGVDQADVRISLDTEAFMRRSCGRWPVERTPALVEGDAALGRRVLEALVVTP